MTNDDQSTIAILENMENITGIKNFSHSNFTLAISYMKIGMPEKALPCFEAEYNAFPLSVRNLYFFSNALKSVGKNDESIAVRQMINEILKLKGLKEKHIPLLIANPQFDLNSTPELLKTLEK